MYSQHDTKKNKITSHWQISSGPWKPLCSPCHKQLVYQDMRVVSSNLLGAGWSYFACVHVDLHLLTPPLTDWNCLAWTAVERNSPPTAQSCSRCKAAVASHWHVSQKRSWSDISDLSCTNLSLWRQTRYFQPRGQHLRNQKPRDRRSDGCKWLVLSSCVFRCFICRLNTYRGCIETWPARLLDNCAFVLLSSAGWEEQKHLCRVCGRLDIRKSFGPAAAADQPHEGEGEGNKKILLRTKE